MSAVKYRPAGRCAVNGFSALYYHTTKGLLHLVSCFLMTEGTEFLEITQANYPESKGLWYPFIISAYFQ